MGAMATQSPFSFVEEFLRTLAPPSFQPPAWVVDEVQRRILLLLNHILIREPEATSRLVRQKGRTVHVQWRSLTLTAIITPAGLLDRASDDAQQPDLILTVAQESPWALVQSVMGGDRPAVRIEGDVQLAAEINWLVDHVRWDLEEDLSQVIGDAPAYALSQTARAMVQALSQFLGSKTATSSTDRVQT